MPPVWHRAIRHLLGPALESSGLRALVFVSGNPRLLIKPTREVKRMKKDSSDNNAFSPEDPDVEELILEEELYAEEGLGEISADG
jgi:hypothetical protein